ncbi:unnamed protein product [Lymnaea stagnalis]|uniref:Uncharacterized protein n=1 Tax=Lymnaea stagnalis TaxID=6523 RepID=A0AAV2H302_LYMST
MILQMAHIEKLQMSSLVLNGASSPESQQAIDKLLKLVTSCAGPRGKFHLLRNNCGGHVTCTSSCSRLLPALSITRTEVKLIISSVQAHLKQHHDCGLFMACVSLHLIRSSVGKGIHVPTFSSLYELFVKQLCDYLASPHCTVCVTADFTDLQVLLAYVRSIILSKSFLTLNEKTCDSLCQLIVSAFVETIPEDSRKIRHSDGIQILGIDKMHVRNSRFVQGLLLEYPEMPVIQGSVPLNLKTLTMKEVDGRECNLQPDNYVKVALMTCSLSGDAEEIIDANYEVEKDVYENLDHMILNKMESMFEEFDKYDVGLVLCQKVIHPKLKGRLRTMGILFVERLGSHMIPYLQDLTGANCIRSFVVSTNFSEFFGRVQSVQHIIECDKSYIQLTQPKSSVGTLVLCELWEERLLELKSSVRSALSGLLSLSREPRLLAGGGCWQIHCSYHLNMMVLNRLHQLSKEKNCSEASIISALTTFRSSLHHWVHSLGAAQHDLAVDPLFHHCWVLPPVDDNSSDTVTCCCGLKSAPQELVSEFELISHTPPLYLKESKDTHVIDNGVSCRTILDHFTASTQALSKGVFIANLVSSIDKFIIDKN